MQIELTKEQYRKLVEVLFLGDWLVNSHRTGAKGDEIKTEYKKLEQHILSYSKEFQLGQLVMEEAGEYFTTMKFEENLMPLIEEYDEYTFWEQLAEQMAEKDLREEIGLVKKLKEEHIDRKYEIEETYQEEFEKNGLRNLVLNKQVSKKK
jgi:hypothetical protein